MQTLSFLSILSRASNGYNTSIPNANAHKVAVVEIERGSNQSLKTRRAKGPLHTLLKSRLRLSSDFSLLFHVINSSNC